MLKTHMSGIDRTAKLIGQLGENSLKMKTKNEDQNTPETLEFDLKSTDGFGYGWLWCPLLRIQNVDVRVLVQICRPSSSLRAS